MEIIATYTGDGGPCVDKIKLTVYQVTSLVWETKQNSGNEAIDVGMNNGGKRIFPGKKSANDADPGGNSRKVDLVATITPAVADRNVYFGVWDVDDPFDQNNAGMANVGLIDSNTSGPDNRPTGESPWSGSAVTATDGKARVTFTVSMQPGNNYRAGATCLTGTVSAVTQSTADEQNQNPNGGSWSDYALPLRWSEMLTVWRKLTVETDSMVRLTFAENTYSTQWTNPIAGLSPDQVELQINDPFFAFDTGEAQFNSGFVELSGDMGTVMNGTAVVSEP